MLYVDDHVIWVGENSGNIPPNFQELMEEDDSTNEDNLQLDFADLWKLSSNDGMEVSHVTRSRK